MYGTFKETEDDFMVGAVGMLIAWQVLELPGSACVAVGH